MQIDSINTVIYTIQFIIPGYIIERMVSSITPQRSYSAGEITLRAIGYSVFNLCIWYWLYMLIRKLPVSATVFWMINFLALILTGTVTGVAIGAIKRKGKPRDFIQSLGIPVKHPIPTAWEYLWSQEIAHILEVTLISGETILGLYSSESFTSSDSSYNDIYLEKTFVKDSVSGEWILDEHSDGIWIEPKQIKYIKIYPFKEDDTR